MPARKQPPSQAEQEQLLANMIIEASNRFEHVGLDRIGVPPMEADARTCKGHSWKDFCTICRFNFCQECGAPLSHLFRSYVDSAFWAGHCGYHAHAAPLAHHARVLQLVDQSMRGQEEVVAVAPEAAPPVAAASNAARKAAAPKKKAAAPPSGGAPEPKRASTWSVSERKRALAAAAAANAEDRDEDEETGGSEEESDHDALVGPPPLPLLPPIVPQINIAVAQLADIRVESTDAAVRRIGDTRFEITVTVVLGQ
jgi:hypothetical protein